MGTRLCTIPSEGAATSKGKAFGLPHVAIVFLILSVTEREHSHNRSYVVALWIFGILQFACNPLTRLRREAPRDDSEVSVPLGMPTGSQFGLWVTLADGVVSCLDFEW